MSGLVRVSMPYCSTRARHEAIWTYVIFNLRRQAIKKSSRNLESLAYCQRLISRKSSQTCIIRVSVNICRTFVIIMKYMCMPFEPSCIFLLGIFTNVVGCKSLPALSIYRAFLKIILITLPSNPKKIPAIGRLI